MASEEGSREFSLVLLAIDDEAHVAFEEDDVSGGRIGEGDLGEEGRGGECGCVDLGEVDSCVLEGGVDKGRAIDILVVHALVAVGFVQGVLS